MAAVSKAQQEKFISMMAPIAIEQAKRHNNQIYASVCIAQAAHESGWGTSKKMADANALFGVKVGKSAYKFGTAWRGAAYKTGTTEYYDGKTATHITDWFRQYDSIKDATEDYFDMLCHCNRYKPALNQPTAEACIGAIVAGGYATGPAYAEKVIKIINLHNLTKYDKGEPVVVKPDYEIGTTYTTQVNLYVRNNPNGEKISFDDLTDNGKTHALGHPQAILKANTRVTCKECVVADDGSVWIRIPSGWICAVTAGGKSYIL